MNEKVLSNKKSGFAALVVFAVLYIAAVVGAIVMSTTAASTVNNIILGVSLAWVCVGWIPFLGFKVLGPNEALVLTLFGKYKGTLKGDGFYFVNPFCVAVNPAAKTVLGQSDDVISPKTKDEVKAAQPAAANKKLSLKIMTLNNNKQKVNDCLGNPVEVGIAVMWRITDTAKAVFNVDNYKEYLSLQCDTSLRNVVRMYPYDISHCVDANGDGVCDDESLRGSSEVVASRIRNEIQNRVENAGIEIIEARITYLAYAREIAAVMLQSRHGRIGARSLKGKRRCRARRRAQGGNGIKPSRCSLRKPRRSARRQFR